MWHKLKKKDLKKILIEFAPSSFWSLAPVIHNVVEYVCPNPRTDSCLVTKYGASFGMTGKEGDWYPESNFMCPALHLT